MNEFIDERDGNRYKVVKINNLLWFAENLKYRGVSHCFPDRNSDNIPEYGCLYTWKNAIKACPESWRLPTSEEFEQLLTATSAYGDSSNIRDSSWKKGSNSSKFGALPAGIQGDSNHYYFGSCTCFWSATPHDSVRTYSLDMYNRACVGYSYINHALSVRCVKEMV